MAHDVPDLGSDIDHSSDNDRTASCTVHVVYPTNREEPTVSSVGEGTAVKGDQRRRERSCPVGESSEF